ncbi:hypothetical protein ES705_15586 [subsurface metagenome]
MDLLLKVIKINKKRIEKKIYLDLSFNTLNSSSLPNNTYANNDYDNSTNYH